MSMGAFSYAHSPLDMGLQIGRYCSLSWNIRTMGPNHPISSVSSSVFTYGSYHGHSNFVGFVQDVASDYRPLGPPPVFDPSPVIENDVWIGQDVLIARGVKIGTGAVVAAGSIVTKDVPPYMIVGGVPARVIRPRFDENLCADLLESEWWKYAFTDLPRKCIGNPREFLSELKEMEGAGRIAPYAPERFVPSEHLVADD